MRKAKEKNKPLLSLAAAGLAALLLFGMATAVLAQGTQGKFVADEWSGIAEADIAEGDSTKDQAENQASTTPTLRLYRHRMKARRFPTQRRKVPNQAN